MKRSDRSVIQDIDSRQLIQLLTVLFAFFFLQIDAFTQKNSIEFEGRQRDYVVYLPQEFQPNLPVVFGFHGYRQGSNFITYSLLHEVADTAGFITVYPQSNPYWNTGLLYPGYPTIDTTVNDVGFISALIDTLYAHYAIDIRRVYSCGFSHGGGMTNVLSGELSNRFAAVASVAGLFNDNSANRYNPVRPLPILHIHGTEDIIETWDGSKANLWSVDSTINYKLEKNGCSLPGDTVLLADLDKTDGCTVEKISYTNCSGEGLLVFYKILGGGHSWPSSAYTFGNEGNKNKDINANVEIINFFKKFENPLVYIPDTAFLYALIEGGVDTDGDSLISYEEAGVVTAIDVEQKNISSLTGIEAFNILDTLFCGLNHFTTLDLSKNTVLTYLHCTRSPLTSLDISKNTALTFLGCWMNKLTRLDVSNNTALTYLGCLGNELTSLDVTNNTTLETMWCGRNQLISLDVSNNAVLTFLDISQMPTLHEVCVWEIFSLGSVDVDYEGSPNVYFTTDCQYVENVFIPDTAFLHALIDEGVDTDGDSLISYGEAAVVTGISATHRDIFNITGIEAFLNLESLVLFYNEIDSLDISNNTGLRLLDVNGNNLTHIDVSMCDSLKSLICQNNYLTSLDVSKNLDLEILECHSNMIETLDLSENRALKFLWCSDMPSLGEVCVWDSFVPIDCVPEPYFYYGTDTVCINASSSPNICFETDCDRECGDYLAPTITAVDSLYQPDNIQVTSSENGLIYLVPGDTEKDIVIIRGVCIVSVDVLANTPVEVPLSDLENGIYWLYAIDSTGNFSEPKPFTIMGVGIENTIAEQFRIYPNPTNRLLTIEAAYSDHYSINVTSMNGHLILRGKMKGTTQQIDLSSFQKGVYFITVRSQDFVTTRKIIKL